jgi:nitronate monooxygenase
MGLDPNDLGAGTGMNLQDSQNQIKAWKDIWSAGHGVGSVTHIAPLVEIANQLKQEYELACQHFPTVGVTQNVA